MSIRRLAGLFLLISSAALAANAAPVPSIVLLRDGTFGGSTESYVAANVFGSATPEIVSCSDSSAYVLGRSGNGYAPLWHSGPAARCRAVAAADRDGDGQAEIFVGTYASGTGTNARVDVYDPRSLGPPRGSIAVALNTDIQALAVGDVDNDGQQEIVAVTPQDTYVYDANTLALQWKAAGKGGSGVLLGNIDTDGRTEIVVNSNPGHVLDAVAEQEEWGYAGGFGFSFHLGNTDADPQLEIVFVPNAWSTSVTVLHGDTFATSNIAANGYVAYAMIGDANGDGTAELIAARNSCCEIEGFRLSDGGRIWQLRHNEYSITGLLLEDFDGDGAKEVAWRTAGRHFFGNAATQMVEWSSRRFQGPLTTATADLDLDGVLEQVVASGVDSYYGLTEVVDFRTRAVKATLKPTSSFSAPRIVDIAIGQFDADAPLEIALAGSEGVWVYDGATLQLQWTAPNAGSYSTRMVAPIVAANVDGDAVDELIVAQTDNTVLVLNGATPIIQWSSLALDGTVVDFDVADVNGDSAKDLVVGTRAGFYVFRMPDGLQRVHMTRAGIRAVAASTAGELAIVHGDGSWSESAGAVRVYAGSTLAEMWNCSLPATSPNTVARYGLAGGQNRLAVSDKDGVRFYPTGGNSCPAYDTLHHGVEVRGLQFIETTGDGRPELALTSHGSFELRSIGLPGELRGDFNGDGMITEADIDALIAYLMTGGAGAPPGADANADGRIALDDVFYLINYRRGTGNPPPPQQ